MVMRKHQRYFPVLDAAGHLLPHFVTVANGFINTPQVWLRLHPRQKTACDCCCCAFALASLQPPEPADGW